MKSYFNKLIKDSELNITTEQWAIMNAVYRNPGASQTDLARACLKDKTNVTRILDLLVKKEYVIRTIDSNDRRVYSIVLTDLGESVLEQLVNIANKAFITALSQQEYAELVRTLKTITCSIERLS